MASAGSHENKIQAVSRCFPICNLKAEVCDGTKSAWSGELRGPVTALIQCWRNSSKGEHSVLAIHTTAFKVLLRFLDQRFTTMHTSLIESCV